MQKPREGGCTHNSRLRFKAASCWKKKILIGYGILKKELVTDYKTKFRNKGVCYFYRKTRYWYVLLLLFKVLWTTPGTAPESLWNNLGKLENSYQKSNEHSKQVLQRLKSRL